MSKLVAPNRVAPRTTWWVDFLGGAIRGLLTTGASAVMTLNMIVWMMTNGYLKA